MSEQPSTNETRQSLHDHAAEKGRSIYAKYGPRIGWPELLRILDDKSAVRYPCRIVFEAKELQAGEFAHAQPVGSQPEDGFTLYVHPWFESQLEKVPYLVLYHLVTVNYGPFASADDAETFGANALGLSKDDYYQSLCAMADEITPA